MRYGHDFLGGARYPDVVKKSLPRDWVLGILLQDFTPFEESLKLVEWALQNGHDVRAHCDWEDDHEWSERQLNSAVLACAAVDALAVRYPGRKVYLSPLLEHRLRDAAARKFFKRVKRAAPHCIIVNCGPEGVKGTVREIHGGGPVPKGRYIYSFDGKEMEEELFISTMKRKHARAEIFFGWRWDRNGKKDRNDKTPRPNRKHWPTVEGVKNDTRLMQR